VFIATQDDLKRAAAVMETVFKVTLFHLVERAAPHQFNPVSAFSPPHQFNPVSA
jgi:hypothetical protein